MRVFLAAASGHKGQIQSYLLASTGNKSSPQWGRASVHKLRDREHKAAGIKVERATYEARNECMVIDERSKLV